MLNNFITALLYEITKFLNENKDFFSSRKLDSLKIPTPVKEYLSKVSEEELLSDIQGTIEYINRPKEAVINENGFLKSIATFLSDTFAKDICKLPTLFYKEKREVQKEAAKKIIKSDSMLAGALRELLVANSYQALLEGITQFLQETNGAPYIVVQTPIELDAEKKIEIKDNLSKEFGSCLPIFQINKNLIGGLRIFADGKVKDFSWLGRINYITSIKYNN